MGNDISKQVCKMLEDFSYSCIRPHATSERYFEDGSVEHFFVLSSDDVDIEVSILVREKQ